MEYILLKKDIKILQFSDDEKNNEINVTKALNVEHLPVHLFLNGKPSAENLYSLSQKLEDFLDNRMIPDNRTGLKETLAELGLNSNIELARKSYFLSLSDQYWICPLNDISTLKWKDINFFENPFDSELGLRLLQNNSKLNKNTSSFSPDCSTNGELSKRWIRIGNSTYLEKAGSGTEQQEPLNEVLASEICRRLKIPYVPYTLEERNNNYFCRCPDMVNIHTELVPMDSVYQDLHLVDGEKYDFEKLIERCKEMQIPDAENSILKILLLDFIIANEDRHSYNISFIRNSDTLEWIGVSPVYDSGKSMYLNKLDFEIEMTSPFRIKAKPFEETQSSQLEKLPVEKIFNQIDFSKLDDIEEWYSEFLKPMRRLSAEKKAALVKALRNRIDEAKKLLEEKLTRSGLKFEPINASKLEPINLVYESLKLNPNQKKEQISASTGLSRATVTRALSKLQDSGKIRRIGSNKTGKWEIRC